MIKVSSLSVIEKKYKGFKWKEACKWHALNLVYALILWVFVIIIYLKYGKDLKKQRTH